MNQKKTRRFLPWGFPGKPPGGRHANRGVGQGERPGNSGRPGRCLIYFEPYEIAMIFPNLRGFIEPIREIE